MAAALREAAGTATGKRNVLTGAADAYLAFALHRPALYEAMLVLPTGLRFGEAGTKPELRAAFEALAAPFCIDVDVATESFWASLHGLVELERSGRIRQGARNERIALVVRTIAGQPARARRRPP